MKKKILITGAAGFIGSHIVAKLAHTHVEIIGIDNLNEYGTSIQYKCDRLRWVGINHAASMKYGDRQQSELYPNYTFVRLSIENEKEIKDLFQIESFDYVIHLAAQAGVRINSIPEEVYIQSNMVGFSHVIDACRQFNIEKFIFASSSSVYGNSSPIPQRESTTVYSPKSLYAQTKVKNEEIAYQYASLYQLPCIGLRFFSVYGPWGRMDMLPMLVADNIQNGQFLCINHDGQHQRDFTYIEDVVNGIYLSMHYEMPQSVIPFKIYNIGSGRPVSVKDFIHQMEQSFQKDATPLYTSYSSPEDMDQTWADTELIQTELNWLPHWTLEQGLYQLATWYKDYSKGYNIANSKNIHMIGLITTKNRDSFYQAFQSVLHQTMLPESIVVVSDSSPDRILHEKEFVTAHNGIYLVAGTNNHAHNYAGSLNVGVDYIVRTYMIEKKIAPSTIYIAILDDDDLWQNDYLSSCYQAVSSSTDFVVSGLTYHSKSDSKTLTIPKHLSIHSFLQGNPHIQGSNTFVRLSILLQAGMFDENMPSTTDRDIFVRIMKLSPHYDVVSKHLVDIYTNGDRITTDRDKKTIGLRIFYRKYQFLMTKEDKDLFFQRNEKLFGIYPDELRITSYNHLTETYLSPHITTTYSGNIIIGMIVTYEQGARRLLEEIPLSIGGKYQIVLLNNLGKTLTWISQLPPPLPTRIHILNAHHAFNNIADNRHQLQEYIYNLWKDKDTVCWILDDDMQLKQMVHFEQITLLAIRHEISKYQSDYDAVVGQYTNDAPLPLMATLRLSLLDYCYSQTPQTTEGNEYIRQLPDYYYALTDAGYAHLESPIYGAQQDLEDVFRGKTITRPLINHATHLSEVKNRGGNTLIMNRELLLLPTCSLKIQNMVARRGDYLWILCAKKEGFRVCLGTFGTFHNREKKAFDYDYESDKMLRDLLGSSMTKAMEKVGLSFQDLEQRKLIIQVFEVELSKRLTHFIENYYRIIGLLKTLPTSGSNYLTMFTETNLSHFVEQVTALTQTVTIGASFRDVIKQIDLAHERLHLNQYRIVIGHHINIDSSQLILLGFGNEGCVYRYQKRVYKLFYSPKASLHHCIKLAPILSQCALFYELFFEKEEPYWILSYPYEPSHSLTRMKAFDLITLLRFGQINGFVLNNLKPDNFIQTSHGIKFIDYGKDILPYSEAIFQKSVERAFQVFRYYFLEDIEFKEIIGHSYQHSSKGINAGINNFQQMLTTIYKEQIHDTLVLQIIHSLHPSKILDYGAGKCKIANQLVEEGYSVDVFDTNVSILYSRALSKVHIIEQQRDILSNEYDLINCNQVLCWIDDKAVQDVLTNISSTLKKDAYFIVSICNPFYTDIQHTMLRGNGRKGSYDTAHVFQEYTAAGKHIGGLEHHRPVAWYRYQLRRYGFQIMHSMETQGIDTDTALSIGEHLVWVCKKVVEPQKMSDTTLLIKTCAMDHNTIYDNIQHIVTQLEDGCQFAERVVCVDVPRVECGKTTHRERAYCEDNETHLLQELKRTLKNGWIDRIIVTDQNNKNDIFLHYFGMVANNTHAQNGQPLFATLACFQQITTPFVFQTDSDILYHSIPHAFYTLYQQFSSSSMVTLAPSIWHSKKAPNTYGHRLEVRSCFLNLELLEGLLPLPNQSTGEYLIHPWHRCVDARLQDKRQWSLRSSTPDFSFVHPTNEQKKDANFIASVRCAMESSFIPLCQKDKVNLAGIRKDWVRHTNADIVIVSRGKNTPNAKVKRMLDSLASQDLSFDLIYTDAHSLNSMEQYTYYMFQYDQKWKNTIYLPNKDDKLEMELLIDAIQLIDNSNALVILIDNDDFLIRNDAISLIWDAFQKGHDYICGNSIRYDKPNKRYSITGFDELWKRNGSNIWVHPICFKRELFDKLDDEDLRIDGQYINICTDFAYAIPLIQVAQSPYFLPTPIYYFEPSLANIRKEGKYKHDLVKNTRNLILQKAKERYEKDNSRYRR